MTALTRLVGKILPRKTRTEVILIFRVGRKYYPGTENNKQCFEAYLHTGDELYLMSLEQEMEV